MNWSAIGAVAELLAAIGVIASLVYLAGQVRSSGKQARQAAIQSVVNQMNTVWTSVSATREHARIWVEGSKGMDGLDDEVDQVRFSAFMLSIMRPYEEIFYCRRDGVVDDWTWEAIKEQCHALMGSPGFADWWELRRAWFSRDFQAHIQEVLDGLPSYQRWRDE